MAAKQRSPQYPFVDLETALDLLRKLYQKVGRGEFLPTDAATAWGYNSVSGPTRSKITTLRQFGLIEGKTRGKDAVNPKLSLRGLTLARRNPTVPDKEYMSVLKEAALTPPAFREIHDMPDATDEVLQNRLVVDREFTEEGAKRCIEGYRATIQFAKLDDDEFISGQQPDNPSEMDEIQSTHPVSSIAPDGKHPGMMKIMLSAEDDDYAWVKRKMTSDEWKLRIKLFKAYRRAIVRDENKFPDSTPNEPTPQPDDSVGIEVTSPE
ncbi:MAG: hypothetical protein OXF44_04460 [Anaerolineaceae bacterium]|nr:hypothetical protein [Anaerolineaceae bacterium]